MHGNGQTARRDVSKKKSETNGARKLTNELRYYMFPICVYYSLLINGHWSTFAFVARFFFVIVYFYGEIESLNNEECGARTIMIMISGGNCVKCGHVLRKTSNGNKWRKLIRN